MIIDDRKTPSVSTLTGEVSSFKIATNAKAFRVLVDGIYADKVGAIVRELLSNAYDAHVRRGNVDTPFEVRLPNALNPTFSVRDYGCSMEHEFVMQSYSTLFESSKSGSNDEVGAFGLGAKSFLAYTDACTLTCWSGSEMRAYAIGLNDAGVPEVRLVHRTHSSAPQGVEVTFAVAHTDFKWFQRSALNAAYGFDVMPRFVGSEVSPIEPVQSGNGWRLFNESLGEAPVIIRQGCAVYPTGRWEFNMTLPYGHSLIVDTPIGTANVTASREALALTAEQKVALRERIDTAIEEVHGQVRAQFEALTTPIARARFAHENLALLGKGDWPLHVKLPFSVAKFDTGAFVAYDSFPVQTLSKMLLIHDDGTKVQRRQLRLRALARQGRSVYVESDLARVREIVKLLDLDRSQVIKIAEMPDVAVSRSSSATPKAKKVYATGTVWAIGNRNDAKAGPWSWRRDRGTFAGLTGKPLAWVGDVVKKAHGTTDVVYLTEKEAETALRTGKVLAEMRIDRLIERELLAIEGIEDTVLAVLVYELLGRRIYDGETRKTLLGKVGISAKSLHDTSVVLFRTAAHDRFVEIERTAAKTVLTLTERYPLLFGSDRKAVDAYIEMCDLDR